MIKLCGIKMEISHFPDHTQCIRIPLEILKEEKYVVEWNYEGDEEMATLLYIVKHLGNAKKRELILPYIPNARMDRVKNPDEVFTLKYFCEFINDLKFDVVYVNDPHSDVSMALLNNVRDCFSVYKTVMTTINKINKNGSVILYFPDNGAAKRYTASKIGTQKVFNATSKSLSFARGVSVDSLDSAQSVCFMSSVLDEVEDKK